jgi:hypothetical protein
MINELVRKLSEGKHDVSLNERGEDIQELKERIEQGFIHIKFTQTQGGTELGIKIDKEKSNMNVPAGKNTGQWHLEGTAILNYNHVRCIVDVNLKTMKGKGYLQIINDNTVH